MIVEEVCNQIFNFLNSLSKSLEEVANISASRENMVEVKTPREIVKPLFSSVLSIHQNVSSLDNKKAKFLSNLKLIKEATCELELAFKESLKERNLKKD